MNRDLAGTDDVLESPDEGFSPTALLFGLIGLALHLVLGFLVLVSGLVAPLWAVGVMAVGWVLALIHGIRVWNGRVAIALGVPIGAWLVYVAILVFGDFVLGWTA